MNDMVPSGFNQMMAQAETDKHSAAATIQLDNVDVVFGGGAYRTLKGVLIGMLHRRGSTHHGIQGRKVLDDNNLTVTPGERLGIVGHNGSGKTTLLKVIAGILPPVAGKRAVVGTIAPVIAQGIGFEPDLPLRLNIKLGLAYVNRMSEHSRELEDSILDFAELTDYADQPLRTLSTGMRARLAFATSLLQTPDILILDEVFATGDARFVKKSQAVMRTHLERTPIVILVSHSADLVREVCSRSIMLEHGRLIEDGDTASVLDTYAKRSA